MRQAATQVIAAQRLCSLLGTWRNKELLSREVELTLNYSERMELRWEAIEGEHGRIIEGGKMSLIAFPKYVMSGDERSQRATAAAPESHASELSPDILTLEIMIEQLVDQHGGDIEDLRDASGAGLIHCLVLANTTASIRLAMKLFALRPSLLLCVHEKGRNLPNEKLAGVFDGEGSLHVLAVNKHEKEFIQCVELAQEQLEPNRPDSVLELLMQKASGTFFIHNVPMYGATPIAYAACFGFYDAMAMLFGKRAPFEGGSGQHAKKGLLSDEHAYQLINGKHGKHGDAHKPFFVYQYSPAVDDGKFGYFPLHAVVACGQTEMFDVLVDHCNALSSASEGAGCPRTMLRNLTPLQLAADLGRKRMFRHLLKKRIVTVWVWGPEAEYKIPLDEIDSSGSVGQMTVMELLVHPDASRDAQSMLLDSFLNGFLHKRYVEKWSKFVCRVYLVYGALLTAYTLLLSLIAAPSIVVSERHDSPADLGRSAAAVATQLVLAGLVSALELLEISFLLLESEDGISTRKHTKRKVVQAGRLLRVRGGALRLLSTSTAIVGCAALLADGDGAAPRSRGWVRVCLSVGASTSWICLLSLGCIPFRKLSTFLNVVTLSLWTDVRQFLSIFVPLLVCFTTGINALMHVYPLWATRWASFWLTLENLLLLSFVQEPPVIHDDSPAPSAVVGLLGDFEQSQADSVLPTMLFCTPPPHPPSPM